MKKNAVLYMILTVITVLALTSVAADFSGRKFTTTLTGAAEIPGPGDPDGTGTAKIWLNHGQSEVCWEISVSEIAPVTAAHIHAAPSGVAGPVVVPLFPPLPDSDGFSRGCISAGRELINAIIQSPEQYYVNVHNAEFPAGALRGQLSK